MSLNINNRHSRFFEIKDLDTQSNYLEIFFKPEIIKNDNGALAMGKFLWTANKSNKSINLKRKT